MTSIHVQLSELSTIRFGRLQETLQVTRQEALGLLVMFWAESRRINVEQGDWPQVLACVPGTKSHATAKALLDAGYIMQTDDEVFVIVDNKGTIAKRERRQEIMRQATAASVSRRKPAPKAAPKRERVAKSTALAHRPQGEGTPTWNAYAEAYNERYGTRPPRSAKTAGQCKMFAERMPQEDAPKVMQFYLQHHDRRYVARMHSLDLALTDAPALHTQWKAGRIMTGETAAQVSSALNYKNERELIQAGLL